MWIPYFTVPDAESSAAAATARGAEFIKPVSAYGPTGKWCVLRDPAGATFALFQH
jgi:predicted enzyme related to lactoylglutathione lyase